MQSRGAQAVAEASALMRLINEAYRVLSNKQMRREYDKSLAEGGSSVSSFAPVPPVEAPTAAAPARAHAGKWRPDREVADSIVGGFARQFQKDLSAASADFKWTDTKLEGFDWASSAGFWTSRYIVAMRGFGKADAQNAKKFANYCNLAIENSVHPLKHTYFLFFFAFQKATDQQVPVLLRRFCANENNERAPGPACIVLTDVVRAKSLLCGPRPHDSRYEQLLGALGLTRSA